MDFRSYIKSASIEELEKIKEFISEEQNRRNNIPKKNGKIVTFTDGASRGNPGHAGIGVLIFDGQDEKILQDFRYLGQCTNNEAEYRALLLALDRAKELTQGELECYLDSELVVRQLNGLYQLKSEKLKKFYEEVLNRKAGFSSVTFRHVPREHPKLQLADKLANRAIDEAMGKGAR